MLARVIVNRLWQHHLGRGIVATANDFGVQGSRPTHPELLDWLAGELIRNGWQLKPMHKLIMTSATYMQSGQFSAENAKLDPENIWLWRRTPQRLEAELIRDSLLAVSGKLDRTLYGPGTLDESHTRRNIYFMIKRSKLVPMMQLFDQPEPLVQCRQPPQHHDCPASPGFAQQPPNPRLLARLQRQLLPTYKDSPAAAVKQGYRQAIAREPDAEELRSTLDFLATQAILPADNQSTAAELALTDFCQVLFGLNEFVYME